MKHLKFVGYGLWVSIGFAFIAGFVVTDPVLVDNLFAFSGLGMIVFGIWGALLLFKADTYYQAVEKALDELEKKEKEDK